MGESATCLMQPFSYASGIPNEAKEGNPIHALGQSISFGRFMSESLAWEKWSTFSHNKYVEEAERYARPGSVAQKKAFFEAHYKQLAARKAAALLEQANGASNVNISNSEVGEDEVRDATTQDPQVSFCEQEVIAPNTQTGSVEDSNGYNPTISKFESSKAEGGDSVAKSLKDELFKKIEMRQMELREKPQLENCLKVEASRKIGEVDTLGETTQTTQIDKPSVKSANTREDELDKTSRKKQAHSSSKSSYSREYKVPSSPAKLTAPTRPRKENNAATPIIKKSAADTVDIKRSTPKSSFKSMTFTPAKEISRLTSTIIRKIDNSRFGSNSKPSKDCSTPLMTPTTASASGKSKTYLATPWSEKRSTRTPLDSSVSASKTGRGRWRLLPTEKKSESPSIFAPFSLRTEERAARRKQKLEEKFNSSQAQKVQQQTTLKEKAETEFRKLRQSFCFKARPLPDFYKERGTPKNQNKKLPLTQPESPTLGRKVIPSRVSAVQTRKSHPPQMPSIKKSGSKHIQEKKHQLSVGSLTSQAAHENTSPNIQHA